MKHPILAIVLSFCLCGGGLLAVETPGIPGSAALAADEASRRIAAQTTAAIQKLGPSPTSKQIFAIVFEAVRSSPDSVLPIVAAAAHAAPKKTAAIIAASATSGVPNPWKKVMYSRLAVQRLIRAASDDEIKTAGNETLGSKRAPDPGAGQPGLRIGLSAQVGPGAGTGDPAASSPGGIPMTLAEAIIRTAFDTEPGLPLTEIQDAVNAALRMHPAALMDSSQGPNAVSGGDASGSNYANEPLLNPKQPAVSR